MCALEDFLLITLFCLTPCGASRMLSSLPSFAQKCADRFSTGEEGGKDRIQNRLTGFGIEQLGREGTIY